MFLKSLILCAACFSFLSAHGETMDVKIKDIDSKESDGAIIIKRGGKNNCDAKYEVTDGDEDLVGKPAPLMKEARNNWDSACKEWKKEKKEMNDPASGNKLISFNCGKMECATETMETTCKSKATYKVKVKLTE